MMFSFQPDKLTSKITARIYLAKQWILLLKPPVSTSKAVELQILDVMKAANKYGNKL